MRKEYQKVNGLCAYVVQECNRGDKPCPGIKTDDMGEWKRLAEDKVNCPYRGEALTKQGYKDREKKKNNKRGYGKR